MAKGIIYLGSLIPAADYLLAQQARTRLRRECAEIFKKVDVLVLPTVPAPAAVAADFYSGEMLAGIYELARFMCPFNLTGTPAISVPTGFNSVGLPLGMQVLGKALDEPTVLRVAHAYEQHAGWHNKRPPI